MKLKKYFLSGMVFISINGFAATYTHNGKVKELTIKDSVIQGNDKSFVELESFLEAGSCPKGSGVIRAIIRDNESGDRQYSMLLSAAVSQQEVQLKVNDDYKNAEGYCYIMNVRYIF